MPILGNFPAFGANLTVNLAEFFLQSGSVANARAIYNILGNIDKDNFPTPGTDALPEKLFQFLPYPNAGGHTHDGVDSANLAEGAVRTEQIDRDECSMIYTGMAAHDIGDGDLRGRLYLTKGVVAVTLAAIASPPWTNWGESIVTWTTGGDYSSPFTYTQVAVVAQVREYNQAHLVVIDRVGSRVGVFGMGAGNVTVDWMAVWMRVPT